MNKPTLAEIREKLCDLTYENRMIKKAVQKLDDHLNSILDHLDQTADSKELLKWYEIEKSKGRIYE